MSTIYTPGRKILSSRDDEEIDGTIIHQAHSIFIAHEELLRAFSDLEDAKDCNHRGQFSLSVMYIQKAMDKLLVSLQVLEM